MYIYTIVFVNICNMKWCSLKKDLHFFDNFFKNLLNHKMIRYRSKVQKCKINRRIQVLFFKIVLIVQANVVIYTFLKKIQILWFFSIFLLQYVSIKLHFFRILVLTVY